MHEEHTTELLAKVSANQIGDHQLKSAEISNCLKFLGYNQEIENNIAVKLILNLLNEQNMYLTKFINQNIIDKQNICKEKDDYMVHIVDKKFNTGYVRYMVRRFL